MQNRVDSAPTYSTKEDRRIYRRTQLSAATGKDSGEFRKISASKL
jgi:hypothetical protein